MTIEEATKCIKYNKRLNVGKLNEIIHQVISDTINNIIDSSAVFHQLVPQSDGLTLLAGTSVYYDRVFNVSFTDEQARMFYRFIIVADKIIPYPFAAGVISQLYYKFEDCIEWSDGPECIGHKEESNPFGGIYKMQMTYTQLTLLIQLYIDNCINNMDL